MQSRSVRASRMLDAGPTGMEMLRQLNHSVMLMENPMEAVADYVRGEWESDRHFTKDYIRKELRDYLERHVRRETKANVSTHPDLLTIPLVTTPGRVAAYVVKYADLKPMIIAIDASDYWWKRWVPREREWTTISYKGNEDAFKLFFGPEVP